MHLSLYALQSASKVVVVFRKTFFAIRMLISLVSCCQLWCLAQAILQSSNHLFFQSNNQLWRVFAAESLLARAKGSAYLCKCKPYPFLGLCHLTMEDNFAHPISCSGFIFHVLFAEQGNSDFFFYFYSCGYISEQPSQTLDKFR